MFRGREKKGEKRLKQVARVWMREKGEEKILKGSSFIVEVEMSYLSKGNTKCKRHKEYKWYKNIFLFQPKFTVKPEVTLSHSEHS